MKKIVCLVLALALTFGLSSLVSAATTSETVTITATSDNGQEWFMPDDSAITALDIPITASAALDVDESQIAASYYVVITWTITSDLAYVSDEDCYTWNVKVDEETDAVTGAEYVLNGEGAKWQGTATIHFDIVNWSNRAVEATMAFVPAAAGDLVESDITVGTTNGSVTSVSTRLANAAADIDIDTDEKVGIDSDGGVTASADIVLKGADVTGSISGTDAKIGQVTIQITEVTETPSEEVDPTNPEDSTT